MNYTLIEEIGRGGMGCVYKGMDAYGHVVALKMMSNKVSCFPEYRSLFQAEVDTLRRMDHPCVVHIVGNPYQDSAGNLILPMEFVEGRTLEKIIMKNGPMRVDDAVRLMTQILEAMQYVHDRRKIHRDIKPSNIMVRPDGSICIIDFGIAKDSKIGSGNTVGRIIGTDGYMSPEQAGGLNIDSRTDIYSLGCVFYYMITGQHAIQKGKNEYETINSILNFCVAPPSTINPSIPKYIDNVVLKAMDKNMTLRYHTASQFLQALSMPAGNGVNPTVTIGRNADNDIIVNSQYVSGHHLVVTGLTDASGASYIEVSDNSTNGTGVDGRPLRKSSMRIEYDGTNMLPEILLAARAECPLNWSEVIYLLKQRGWSPAKASRNSGSVRPPVSGSVSSGAVSGGGVSTPPPVSDVQTDNLNFGLALLCFFVPIVGFIIWGTQHRRSPRRAITAGIIAIVSCSIDILLAIIALAS